MISISHMIKKKCIGIMAITMGIAILGGCDHSQDNVKETISILDESMHAESETSTVVVESSSAQEPTSAITESTSAVAETTAVEESFVAGLSVAAGEQQLIIVEANGSQATVTMHEKINGCWTEIMRTQGYVGKNGVGKASENDTKTPAGCFTLSHAFGVDKDPGSTIGYVQVGAEHYWVDDPDSKYYNQFVSTKEIDAANWKSAEHLIDYPDQYAYAVAIDYNLDCVPGEGSAIFLHCANGLPTYGCVAIPEKDMIFVLTHLQGECKIVIDESGTGLLEK